MANNLKQVSIIFYRLTRDWGTAITIQRPTNQSVNTQTGVITTTQSTISLSRAIVVDHDTVREDIIRLFNSNFKYGGNFQEKVRIAIIDTSEPGLAGAIVYLNDLVTVDSLQYSVVEIYEITAPKKGLILKLRRV